MVTKNISGGLNWTHNVFVTNNDDIYVDDGIYNRRVMKWTANSSNGTVVMNVNGTCYGLFVDLNDTLYCSTPGYHIVMKKSMKNISSIYEIAAGNGTAGATSDMLNEPYGIFVNINFDLYVADCGNNRIQLFPSGELNATTVVGNGTNDLNCPIGVVLDGDDNLFVMDYFNFRIVEFGPNGFPLYRWLLGN